MLAPFTSHGRLPGGPVVARAPTANLGLRAQREATELARSITIELDEAYLADIARLEARPENKSGADKHHQCSSPVVRAVDPLTPFE